ncbi:hypothetical protein SANA_03570 [Gottschalkiaceae bacterium SANA]|nr:hypothetical protein SANA_03570 [Gottschalkiaceae bacterium SANA]
MGKCPKYTIEEKNKIVEEYLSGDTRTTDLLKKYKICDRSVLAHWVEQYPETGTTYDNRGKGKHKRASRSKKTKTLSPEDMTREELIEYVKALEYKKMYLTYPEKQKKNSK